MSEPYEIEEYFSFDENVPTVELPELWLGKATSLEEGATRFMISIKRKVETSPIIVFALSTEARQFLQEWLRENFPDD